MSTTADAPSRSASSRAYTLVDRIAGGGHGEIWRAVADDGTIVATKLLGGPGVTKEAQLRFFQEQGFRFDHENVVGPRGTTAFDGVPALVMDLVDGANLRDIAAANGGTVPDSALRSVAADALAGLTYLHAHGIVHRDISPGNLLVEPRPDGSWRTCITDFGCALDLNGVRLTAVPGVIGTHGFTAPEVHDGLDADERSDLWSLGATIRSVRTTDTSSHDVDLDRLLDALGSDDPDARPADAATALALLAQSDTPIAPGLIVPRLPPMPARSRRRQRAIVAAVVAIAVVFAAVLWWPGSTTNHKPWQRVVASTPLPGYDPAIALGRDDHPFITHTSFAEGHLLLTRCGDSRCTEPVTTTIDSGRLAGYYSDVEVGPDDRPIVAYQDSARGELVVRECSDNNCTRSTLSSVPIGTALSTFIRANFAAVNPQSTATFSALHPRIVLRGSTRAVLYDDAVTTHVRLATRSCSGGCNWSVRDLGPGSGADITVLDDGRPVVAGTGVVQGRLWFVVCNDIECAHPHRIDTPFVGNAVAITHDQRRVVTAMTIYPGGRAVVSDMAVAVTALDLTSCIPNFRPLCARPEETVIRVADQARVPGIVMDHGAPLITFSAPAPIGGVGIVRCHDLRCRGPIAPTVSYANRIVGSNSALPDAGNDPKPVVSTDGTLFVAHSNLPPTVGGVSAGSLAVFSAPVPRR